MSPHCLQKETQRLAEVCIREVCRQIPSRMPVLFLMQGGSTRWSPELEVVRRKLLIRSAGQDGGGTGPLRAGPRRGGAGPEGRCRLRAGPEEEGAVPNGCQRLPAGRP